MIHGMISGLLWSLDTALIGLLLSHFTQDERWVLISPLISTFLHDTISALCYWLNTWRKKQLVACLRQIKGKGGKFLLLASILGGPLGMTAYVFSIQALGAGLTAVFSAFYPAVGAALAALFLKQKMSRVQWVALFISILAIIILSLPGTGDFTVTSKGLFFVLVCVFCWGIESVLSYYAMTKAKISEEAAIFWRQTVSTSVYALGILPLFSGWSKLPTFLSHSAFWLILPAGLLGSISYLQYYTAIRKLGAGPGMALNVTYSAWAMIFNIFILHSLPSLVQVISGIVVVLSSLVAAGAFSWSKQKN